MNINDACARRHALFADLGGREIGGLSYDDVWYNLMNVAFKAPAEHTFDGMRFGGARPAPVCGGSWTDCLELSE